MNPKLIYNGIAVKKSPLHRYGVFAEKDFKKGEIIEECCIFFTEGQERGMVNYYFKIEDKKALLSGQGCVYNHSKHPNVDYYYDLERNIVHFEANADINAGEELLISYGEDWFDIRNMKMKYFPRWKKWFHPKYSVPMRACIAVGLVVLATKINFITHYLELFEVGYNQHHFSANLGLMSP